MKIIGILHSGSPQAMGEQFAEFHGGLRRAGYVDGQNVTIEYRWANDDYSRLAPLATELIRLPVSVLVAAGGTVSALAARDAAKGKQDVSVVFAAVTDPVKSGLVTSLKKPGGNVTGTAALTSELDPKRLELLHELAPDADIVGVLVNAKRPGLADQSTVLEKAARDLGLKLEVQKAASENDINTAFKAFARQRVGALLVTADPFFNSRRTQVVACATELKVPAIYQWSGFVAAGGLMSYGPRIVQAYRQAGLYAGRILGGAKAGSLPVVLPTKFDLVVDLERAKSFRIRPELLARAMDAPKQGPKAKLVILSTHTG